MKTPWVTLWLITCLLVPAVPVAADEKDVPLFINARTDVFFQDGDPHRFIDDALDGRLDVIVDHLRVTEHALDPAWAKKLGVELETLLVSQPSSGDSMTSSRWVSPPCN